MFMASSQVSIHSSFCASETLIFARRKKQKEIIDESVSMETCPQPDVATETHENSPNAHTPSEAEVDA